MCAVQAGQLFRGGAEGKGERPGLANESKAQESQFPSVQGTCPTYPHYKLLSLTPILEKVPVAKIAFCSLFGAINLKLGVKAKCSCSNCHCHCIGLQDVGP